MKSTIGSQTRNTLLNASSIAISLIACLGSIVQASSHREAPFITENPKVDATDFYMFNSYEPGREGYVTLIANYIPLQDPYGGPNYFTMDPNARYDIHIDNDGDAREDVTFRFEFTNVLKNLTVPVGGVNASVPLMNIGGIGPQLNATGPLNIIENFTVKVAFGHNPLPATQNVVNAATGSTTFIKPADNIGTKSIPDYAAYATNHVYDVAFPGWCTTNGRMFVGQRKDPFVVNLGKTFDLVNLNPLGPVDGGVDDLANKNVTSLILEIPTSCLTEDDSVIGGWTTASLRKTRNLITNPTFAIPSQETGTFIQVSRLGMPLVNELVIGLKDKDRFNASEAVNDGQFAIYVTNPTLPVLLNVLFGVTPPCLPRNDLVAAFLTGVPGLNKPIDVTPAEMLRLNTNTSATNGIPAKPKGMQNNLGVIGGDLAGFPNGRRPGDDVVDIALRVVMGVLYPDAGEPNGCAPAGTLPLTDGAIVNDSFFDETFPYLLTPLPGSGS